MTVPAPPRRYYVVPPSGPAVGFDREEAAVAAAKAYGEGAHVVDTLATPYHPMASCIEQGEPVYLPIGAWDTRCSLDDSLIEAVKKGAAPIVQAFLAKGASVTARDGKGGTALHWAAARGVPDCLRVLLAAGADASARDAHGTTPLALARRKARPELVAILEAAGAAE